MGGVFYVLRIDQPVQLKKRINCNSRFLFLTQSITGLRIQHPFR
jgi:hypothetical protein